MIYENEDLPQRIGIFGGSFDPPHNGHIKAAEKFYSQIHLDLMFVIPSFIPPHKAINNTSADQRLEMTKLAFFDFSGNLNVSDCEIVRGGRSYTLYTILEIKEKYKNSEIFLYVGSDMFLSFETWYKVEKLFESSTLCVMPRIADKNELVKKAKYFREKFNAKIIFLNGDVYEVSSTEIREAFLKSRNEFVKKNLTDKVVDYIDKENLYRKGAF